MKTGLLFSGGKDSCYAAFLAKKQGYKISCLISLKSKNKNSYMYHTPNIENVSKQAGVMKIPLITQETFGEKEKELEDLEKAIRYAIKKFKIQGIVTGAIESVYQSSRIQKICNELGIECFNPLWQKDQIELLEELVKNRFKVILVGVFAFPLDDKWLGRLIDKPFIVDMIKLKDKYKINPAGEGGEFESFVLDCPLFSTGLIIERHEDFGGKNSLRRELSVK